MCHLVLNIPEFVNYLKSCSVRFLYRILLLFKCCVILHIFSQFIFSQMKSTVNNRRIATDHKGNQTEPEMFEGDRLSFNQ